jgi:hypothetical protein
MHLKENPRSKRARRSLPPTKPVAPVKRILGVFDCIPRSAFEFYPENKPSSSFKMGDLIESVKTAAGFELREIASINA